MKPLKILIGCEESQVVTLAFRARGHEVYSCDIQDCSGGRPEFHIKDSILHVLSASNSLRWDLGIFFPPCTDLASSGARWFPEKQADGRQMKAISFFMSLVHANIEKIAIENPIGVMSTHYRRTDQIIQPWQFGHGETKSTCLWLKNLPKLQPTNVVSGREQRIWKMAPSQNRAKERSKTFPGIASAMASQWSPDLGYFNNDTSL